MRWQSLAKVLCCGPAHGGVQAGVQTAVARSGKGAVQGAVQACCEAAAYSAVAKSGRGAVLSRMLYRLWLAAVRSGGKVWETCCAACCRLARSGKGYAAGCWLREGAFHRNFHRCCRGTKSGMVLCCAGCCLERWRGLAKVLCRVLCRLLARAWCQGVPCRVAACRVLCSAGQCGGELWERGCCVGCCPECGGEVWQRCCAGCYPGCGGRHCPQGAVQAAV